VTRVGDVVPYISSDFLPRTGIASGKSTAGQFLDAALDLEGEATIVRTGHDVPHNDIPQGSDQETGVVSSLILIPCN